MVKADPKHDYYADLNLPASADVVDIKKQFKKLALKYHPDRNPGKEIEFNSKFQEIQSAHEILIDPIQKSKYDADRRKTAAFTSYTSPTATNTPARSPYTNFPPPPRPHPTTSKTTYPQSPSTGASRYANFAANDKSWTRQNNDAQAKTEAARAWAEMKHGPNAGGSFGKNTRQNRANSFQTQPNNEPSKSFAPRPRAAWDQNQEKQGSFPGMARANTMRVPKKAGFAPGTPGGDEPPARTSSSYFTAGRGERQGTSNQTQYPPPPPGPPPNPRRPDPLKPESPRTEAFRTDPLRSAPPRYDVRNSQGSRSFMSSQSSNDPFTNSERKSTPYATTGGERTYLSSEGINRSASSNTNLKNGWPSGYTPGNTPLSTPGSGRHRSASPNIRSPNRARSVSSESSYSSEEEVHPHARRASADTRPVGLRENERQRRPGNPSVKHEDEDELRPKQRSTWDSQTKPAPALHRDYSASQPGSRRGSGGSDDEGFSQHRVKNSERGQQLPKSPLHTTAPWNYQNFEKPFDKPLEKSKSWQEKYGSKEDGNNQRQFERPSSGRSKDAPPMYEFSDNTSSITPRPLDVDCNDLAPNPLKRKTWPYWAIPSSVMPRKHFRPQTSRNSSFHWNKEALFAMLNPYADSFLRDSFHFPSDRSSSISPLKTQSAENINTNFSSSDWHGKFNGDAEDYLSATSNGSVPRGRTSPIKGRPSVFRERPKIAVSTQSAQGNSSAQMPPPPTIPVPQKVPNPAKFSTEKWHQTFKEPNWAFPPPPPIQSPRPGNPKRPKTPRKMSTANKRPTVPKTASVTPANDGEDEGDASNEASSALGSEVDHTNGDSPMDIDPAVTPPSPIKPPQSPLTSRSDTFIDPIAHIIRSAIPPDLSAHNMDASNEGGHLNLSDLKKTAPFGPSQAGLQSLDDLKTTLPFPSCASAIRGQSSAPQQLLLPNPPKAPAIPDHVNQSTWEPYIAYMRAYMAEWSLFNTKMINHFSTRQAEVETKLGNDWMSAIGEEGYAKYMKGVGEDFRVREHWDVSWEKHRECMRGLGRVRELAVKAKCHV
ncbi:hypothetical protein MMC26_007273 [Xylographa opegraphella]|nr:hypothetical protein [Xylographa opegraphella]